MNTDLAELRLCPKCSAPLDGGPHVAGCPRATAAGLAPFEDGWPNVPSLTVTLDGKAIMTVPLYADDRRFYEVGPYTIWVATP